ncbi:MAG: RNA polymerase factor sigma-54 [Armatimonadota bacterium]
MAIVQRQTQGQRQQQRAEPQLLLTNRLLQMPAVELRQRVVQELAENPALESPDEPLSAVSRWDAPLLEGAPEGRAFGRVESSASAAASVRHSWIPGEDDLDPLDLAECPSTLADHLRMQLAAAAEGDLRRIGSYLIDSITPDGYLHCPLEEAARALSVSHERVEAALRLLQSFDPAGVGARSLQECLLLQLRSLAEDGEVPPLAEPIVCRCWRELAASRWRAIARSLHAAPVEVEKTAAWIRHNLSPYPGSRYGAQWSERTPDGARPVRPDVRIYLTDERKVAFELHEHGLPELHVSPVYTRLFRRLKESPESFSEPERRHVSEYLRRAQLFLRSLNDRKRILDRVMECIVEEQEMFLRSEQEEDLRPVTQSQVASFLQVHESTISRAVSDKFVQLVSGRVVPASFFFDRATSVRALVAAVVASEDPASPYSDQQIADLLRSQGVRIARRTVLKYREEMNILSSRQRARAPRARGDRE